MGETRTFAKPSKVTIDELAGMTKRRFDELEEQIEYRFDLVDRRLDVIDKRLDTLAKEVREGFKGLRSAK